MTEKIQPEEVINSVKESNEVVIWAGQPQQGIIFRKSDILVIPFSIISCAASVYFFIFSVYSIVNSKLGPENVLLLPLSFLFIIVSIFLVYGRFKFDSNMRENSYYGVTSKKIIFVTDILNKKILTINIDSLSEVYLKEKPNGKGNIFFTQEVPQKLSIIDPVNTVMFPYKLQSNKFEMIENAKDVYENILKLLKKS